VRFRGDLRVGDAALREAVTIDDEGAAPRRPDEVLARDALGVLAAYHDRGYVLADVGPPSAAPARDGPYVDVTFPVVREGPRFRVGRLAVEDPDGAPDGARAAFATPDGGWFARAELARGLERLRSAYRERGYAEAAVEPHVALDEARAVVDLVVRVERGPLTSVERVEIVGARRVPDADVRARVAVREGALLHESDLRASKASLEALGRFARVGASYARGSAPGRAVVRFELVER
jgi:outer membrane protein insertion porin family